MNRENILQTIIKHKLQEIEHKKSVAPLEQIKQQCKKTAEPRDFTAAIQSQLNNRQPAVIAEIKKSSPSKGVIRDDFDPITIAKSYEQAAATCLSVLTDEKFFQGNNDYLIKAKANCALPVLRKDFIIDPYQVYEARAIGADCILLIVAALDKTQLSELANLASQLGMSVLVECHNQDELQTALTLDTPLIGINNRDLQTFETSLDTTLNLLSQIPNNRIIITESGIRDKSDIALMRRAGVNTFLIGETFMRANDPGEKLRQLFFS